jgi:HEPN domain-containing protein
MDTVSFSALENAREWLKSASLNKNNENYAKSLYDMEMALEIAVKGVLIALGKNFPKKHAVVGLLRRAAQENGSRSSKEFIESTEELEKIFNELLELRNISGYSFQASVKKEEFKKLAEEYYGKTAHYVELCDKEITALEKVHKKR